MAVKLKGENDVIGHTFLVFENDGKVEFALGVHPNEDPGIEGFLGKIHGGNDVKSDMLTYLEMATGNGEIYIGGVDWANVSANTYYDAYFDMLSIEGSEYYYLGGRGFGGRQCTTTAIDVYSKATGYNGYKGTWQPTDLYQQFKQPYGRLGGYDHRSRNVQLFE